MTVIRCCSLCRTRLEKENLHRIVSEDDKAILDVNQNINSRGMYICKDKKCIDRLIKQIDKNKFTCKLKCNNDTLKKLLISLYELSDK